ESENAVLLVASLVAVLVVCVRVLVFLFVTLTQKVRKQQASDALAAQEAPSDQEFENAVLLIVFLSLVTEDVPVSGPAFLQQVGEEKTPRAPPAQKLLSTQDAFQFVSIHVGCHDSLSFLFNISPYDAGRSDAGRSDFGDF